MKKTNKKTTKVVNTTKTNSKKTNRRAKVFNLLKGGKKISIQALTKSAYGTFNEQNAKNTYTILSDLRRVRNIEIISLGEGKFQLH